MPAPARFAEFFAGVGLVRLGLEQAGCEVVWSNDIEPAKRAMYVNHFGEREGHRFVLEDVAAVDARALPPIDAAWASFPCTDLSLAGWRRGLAGRESSTFFHFTRILRELQERPRVVALENVVGLATSHGGADIRTAVAELNELGYSVDILVLDARRFVPQSRPRLFVVGALDPPAVGARDDALRPPWLRSVLDDDRLITHHAALPRPPEHVRAGFSAIAETVERDDTPWWPPDRVRAFVHSLSPLHAARLEAMRVADAVRRRTMYRRTRSGRAVWEIRSDDIAGCLRTARGGSSRQAVVRVGRGAIDARWMTAHEYAALMGAPDFNLEGIRPAKAMFGFGDAVCVPAVRWLAENYLRPLVDGAAPMAGVA